MTSFADAAARVSAEPDNHAIHTAEASAMVGEMSLQEKLNCLDGDVPFWPGIAAMMTAGYTSRSWPAAEVDRLGIPGLAFADGPRGCVVGPSTTFPVSMARGASFDPDLERRIGRIIGTELRAIGANFTGAVCMNLLRHPAWGRAQETYGEDPHHVGEMAVALTEGLQEHVMACMKHFALNSMENARFKVDITVDERSLHEVYLPHFRRVAEAGVASVMSAYNSVNGDWCGEHQELLTSILREEWGWDGFVITDFVVGLRNAIKSVQAGCNIEMPFAQQRAVALADGVSTGQLDVADIDARVTEILATFLRFAHAYEPAPETNVLASPEHRAVAREAAVSSAVLLRNEAALPLTAGQRQRIAVLGRLADLGNLGDAGSSNVTRTPNPVTPLAGLKSALPQADVVHHADDLSITENADAVVVVVGFTKHDEGEFLGAGMMEAFAAVMPPMDHPTVGTSDPAVIDQIGQLVAGDSGGDLAGGADGGDRSTLRLPADQEALIEAACSIHHKVIVVVIAGSAVVMPWLEQPAATLQLWYAGSEGGTALADILLGAEPGGRLPFAVPFDEDDLVPFDRDADEFTYGLLHGQWWLDANGTNAQLPFGHGLSYTTFSLGESHRSETTVTAHVTNTGDRTGSTVVFVYASVPDSNWERPIRRLVGFSKVSLAAQESRAVQIPIDLRQLDVRVNGAWLVEDKPVALSVGFDAATTTSIAL